MHKLYFFAGKGGVGKSTIAASFALACARQSKRCLLISTDPAHNLSDLFQKSIGNRIQPIAKYLDAIEIDAHQESRRYINEVKSNIKGLVAADLASEVDRQIDLANASPGTEESALLDKIISIVINKANSYDKIIIDTAPTGHTIRLLSLPKLMGVWIEGMLARRSKINENYASLLSDGEPIEDPIYQLLQNRKERFAQMSSLLLNPHKTHFTFVVTPEKLPILEAKRALSLLEKYQIKVNDIIVNKMLPADLGSQFWKKRKTQENIYLDFINQQFKQQKIKYLPLLDSDIASFEHLELISNYFEG